MILRTEKKKPIATIPLGLYAGILIYDVEYSIDDYIIYRWDINGEQSRLCKSKVHYETSRPYFKSCNHRYHLDEAMRNDL